MELIINKENSGSRGGIQGDFNWARGNPNPWVSVEADCITGTPCFVSNLQVSGGPGQFNPSYGGARSGAIHKGVGGGLGGQYSYSFVLKYGSRSCVASGSFSMSGGKGNVKIGHYPDCRLSSIHEF